MLYRGRGLVRVQTVSDCIKSWTKDKKAIIRNPNSTRPWQHVLDVLNGYIVLASKLRLNKNYTVKHLILVQQLVKILE